MKFWNASMPAPPGPRFAMIGGVRTSFSEAALNEARTVVAPERPLADDQRAVAIDDEDTVEVDDAISCEPHAGRRFSRPHTYLTRCGLSSQKAVRSTRRPRRVGRPCIYPRPPFECFPIASLPMPQVWSPVRNDTF